MWCFQLESWNLSRASLVNFLLLFFNLLAVNFVDSRQVFFHFPQTPDKEIILLLTDRLTEHKEFPNFLHFYFWGKLLILTFVAKIEIILCKRKRLLITVWKAINNTLYFWLLFMKLNLKMRCNGQEPAYKQLFSINPTKD